MHHEPTPPTRRSCPCLNSGSVFGVGTTARYHTDMSGPFNSGVPELAVIAGLALIVAAIVFAFRRGRR